jgi:hypothetical protein
MNDIRWSAQSLPDVPQWTEEQAFDGYGPCVSCGNVTWLRADPYAGQPSCRPR